VAHREEVEKMSETIEQTWEQELLARGEARGEERGRTEGQLIACRENLRLLLEERFGPLTEVVVQRIEAATDLERLRSAIRQVVHMADLSKLDL
jgi:predicted transposase YdaD